MSDSRIAYYSRVGHETETKAAIYSRTVYPMKSLLWLAKNEVLVDYAKELGYSSLAFYEDLNCSGLRFKDRPSFRKMQSDIEEGSIKTVIVFKYSQISRNLSELLPWIAWLHRKGVKLIVIDPHTGNLMESGILDTFINLGVTLDE